MRRCGLGMKIWATRFAVRCVAKPGNAGVVPPRIESSRSPSASLTIRRAFVHGSQKCSQSPKQDAKRGASSIRSKLTPS